MTNPTADQRCAHCGGTREEHLNPDEFVARPAIDVRTAGSDGHWDHADIQRLCEYRDRLRELLGYAIQDWETHHGPNHRAEHWTRMARAEFDVSVTTTEKT